MSAEAYQPARAGGVVAALLAGLMLVGCNEGVLRDAAGNPILLTRSGGPIRVVVFELADGSAHALGIGHVGVDTAHLTVLAQGS